MKFKSIIFLVFLFTIFLSGCVQDDELSNTSIDSLEKSISTPTDTQTKTPIPTVTTTQTPTNTPTFTPSVTVISNNEVESLSPQTQISKATPVPTKVAFQKNIIMSYSGQYQKAKDNKIYLAINIRISNHGYDDFTINPSLFNLIANGIKYNISSSYNVEDIFEYVIDPKRDGNEDGVASHNKSYKLYLSSITNGGVNNGIIAFEVPSNIESYQLQYRGSEDFEIIYKPN